MKPSMRIAVDFDGTICEERYPDCGPMMKDVRWALSQFRQMGIKIWVYSCRSHKKIRHTEKAMRKYLKDNKIPYDRIELCRDGKPLVDWYIDDRAIWYSPQRGWKRIVRLIKKLYMQRSI